MVQSWNSPGLRGFFAALRRPHLLHPSCMVRDVGQISFKAAKAAGIRAVCFDKDNCLTLPYEDHIYGPLVPKIDECIEAFGHDRVAVLSNSAGSSDDLPNFCAADRLEHNLKGIRVIRHGEKVCPWAEAGA